MDTIDFIRYHTRLILESSEGEGDSEPKPAPKPAPKPSSKSETRPGQGDFRGKYSRAVRGTRASNAAKQAEGLAKSNPQQLLKNLKLDGYETVGSDKTDEIFKFLTKFRGASPQIAVAFEKPERNGSTIDIPIASLDKKSGAIKETQAARYVRAALTAAFLIGLVDFDPTDGGNRIQTRSTGSDNEKKFFVRVTVKQ
jgi:hypothetical protein